MSQMPWIAKANFSRRCVIDEKGCWIWNGRRTPEGYGPYQRAYEIWLGAWPQGRQREHRCGRGRDGCVNPYHIEAVSPSENSIRGYTRQHRQMSLRNLRMARLLHKAALTGTLAEPPNRRSGGI